MANFNNVDAGYEADADCPKTTSGRSLQVVDMMEDPLGLRLAKRTLRRGLFRKAKPRSLEIRQGRLQPQPPPPPAEEEVPPVQQPPVEGPPAVTPPAEAPPAESSPVVVPPAVTVPPVSASPVPTPPAGLPEEESSDSSDSDGEDSEDSPSPTMSTFPEEITGVITLPNGSQTTISGPSATDGLTSRPVAQDDSFDPSRQAQDPTLGIAFGSVGAAAILICLVFGIWFLCRYRRKKRTSMVGASSIPPNTNSYMAQANLPPDQGLPRRSPSSLMDELMTAAYDVESGAQAQQQMQAPHGYLNEKRYDPSQQLPILQPAPVVQPTLRWSIASWVRRHNPLKLNPVNGRNSMYSTTSTAIPADPAAPPVPAVPALFQSRSPSSEDDRTPLVPPPLVMQRAASSHYSDQGNGQSPISEYARNSGTWLHPSNPQQQQHRNLFNARAVSMAPTEQTTSNMSESTWASWGAGVTRPQQQHLQQPHTPRRAWIEKCVKLGGWK